MNTFSQPKAENLLKSLINNRFSNYSSNKKNFQGLSTRFRLWKSPLKALESQKQNDCKS